jgi:aspartate-semialdehyde dehydrogenase
MITVHDDPFRPQPRLDRDADGGMTTSVGRTRDDHALDNGIKCLLVSHNTKMGAAKGAVLVAEYLATPGSSWLTPTRSPFPLSLPPRRPWPAR